LDFSLCSSCSAALRGYFCLKSKAELTTKDEEG